MRRYDLICFDVDGTLVTHPEGKIVWEILNRRFNGNDSANQSRFRQYMQGEITYPEWVALDVGDWIRAGATRTQILEAISGLYLIHGARETLLELKGRGHLMAIISGTIDLVIDSLLPDHPFDYVFLNKVFFDRENRLKDWEATPYDVDGKVRALHDIAGRHQIAIERCAFVGDSFNDVDIAREAGFSVALNPKCDDLIEACDVTVRSRNLADLLPYFPDGV